MGEIPSRSSFSASLAEGENLGVQMNDRRVVCVSVQKERIRQMAAFYMFAYEYRDAYQVLVALELHRTRMG